MTRCRVCWVWVCSMLTVGLSHYPGKCASALTLLLPDELWKFHRSMTRPFFSKDRISHFDNFDRHATDALQRIKDRMREGYAVDWQVRAASPCAL